MVNGVYSSAEYMMKRSVIIIFLFVLGSFMSTFAQSLQLLKQVKMSKWNIPAGDYSGIAYLGGDRYAVVSDKQEADGYFEFLIQLNDETGEVEKIEYITFHKNGNKSRDAEDICYVKSTDRIFIAAEDDQRILEYDTNGKATGRELAIPQEMNKGRIVNNYGFESLAYSDETALFWSCTENTLAQDGVVSAYNNRVPSMLRIQSFNRDLNPFTQYLYLTDIPKSKKTARQYAFGVPAICALDGGSLLILEREFFVAQNYFGSSVINKIYKVAPANSSAITFTQNFSPLSSSYAMPKMLLAEWKTTLNLAKRNIANYEGMCLGPKLKDGRQTILLISDSQGGYGNSAFHLKDYLRVGILSD